jgi:hypothetical protein
MRYYARPLPAHVPGVPRVVLIFHSYGDPSAGAVAGVPSGTEIFGENARAYARVCERSPGPSLEPGPATEQTGVESLAGVESGGVRPPAPLLS